LPLTVREIDTARPRTKPYKLADAHGLCLLITPSGGKLWRYRYYFDGKEKMMALGEYPLVTLSEARERRFEARKTQAAGTDPMAKRKAKVQARQMAVVAVQRAAEDSFERVTRKWWERWAKGTSPRHADTVMRRMEADVFPAYGQKALAEITPTDVRELMRKVEKRDARDVAKRIHETTSQVYRFAIANGLTDRNPAADFKPGDILAAAVTENRRRVDVKDLPELLVAIDEYNGDAITVLAMKLMAYTFVRTSELIEAPWEEVDLEGARWTIPKERMKMETPHIVPLARQAVGVLRALRLLSGNRKLVFPGALNKDRPMSNNTILYALYRLGYRGRMTGHGFRGLASTVLHEHEFPEAHIDIQLAHQKRDKVAAAYNHAKYWGQRMEMMQWWADYLDAQLAKGRRAAAA